MRDTKCGMKKSKFNPNLKSLKLRFLSKMARRFLLNFLKCFSVSCNISLSSQTGTGLILLFEKTLIDFNW